MGELQSNFLVKPEEFFREKVTEAIVNQKLEIDDEVEFYLVNLLIEFINPAKLESTTGEVSALETPLALMLQSALEAPPPQKLKIFKYLGDSSLYLAGFFQDYFNRKTYDVNYYISLGASAYESASSLVRDQHGSDHFSEMFLKLSHQFNHLVEIVAEVSESQMESRPIDVLAIYDRWTRTNSERLRKALTKVGIIPIQTSQKERQ